VQRALRIKTTSVNANLSGAKMYGLDLAAVRARIAALPG